MTGENLAAELERAQSVLVSGERIVSSAHPDDTDAWVLERLLQSLDAAIPTEREMLRYFSGRSSVDMEKKLSDIRTIITTIEAHLGQAQSLLTQDEENFSLKDSSSRRSTGRVRL